MDIVWVFLVAATGGAWVSFLLLNKRPADDGDIFDADPGPADGKGHDFEFARRK